MPRAVCESLMPDNLRPATDRPLGQRPGRRRGASRAAGPTAKSRYAVSVTSAAARGTFHPPAWSVATAVQHVRAAALASAWRSTPPEPTTRRDVGERPRRCAGLPAGGRAGARRPAPRAAPARGRAPARPSSDREVSRVARRRGRHTPSGAVGRRSSRCSRCGGLDDALGVPAHAEVALDGAGVPQRRDDVLAQARRPRPAGVRHGVDVGRRAADVDDEDVAVQPPLRRAPRRRAARRPASPPRTIAAKAGSRDSPLPPMTWRRKAARIAARAGLGRDDADLRAARCRRATVGRPVAASSAAASSRASTLPATTTGTACAVTADRPWRAGRRCAAALRVAAVGAADEQHDVRAGCAQVARRPAVDSSPGGDVDDLGAGATGPTRWPAWAVTVRS